MTSASKEKGSKGKPAGSKGSVALSSKEMIAKKAGPAPESKQSKTHSGRIDKDPVDPLNTCPVFHRPLLAAKMAAQRKANNGGGKKPVQKYQMVSRHSGMVAGSGTFGKETRFDRDKLMSQNGAHSPWGRAYLQRSRFWRGKDEAGPIAGMGVGPRPINIQGTGLPNVGPGSYTPVTSTAKTTSALDGPKYCKMTIKTRNKVIVGAVSPHEEARKPGPGTYVLPDEISQGGIKIGLPLREVSGEGKLCDALYDVSPGLGSKVSPDLKSTFGLAARWEEEDTTTSQSPKGDLYYSHCKLTEDYTAHARASSLGVGPRPMLVEAQHSASPASYYPITSSGKLTSALDGFTYRYLSPVKQFSTVSSLKRKSLSEKQL